MLTRLNGSLGRLGRSAGVAAAPFSPLDIPGLRLWLDFADVSTLFQDAARTTPVTADGQAIGGVTDKSNNGRHAAQAELTNKPIYKINQKNGKSIALFDGTNDYMTVNFGTTFAQPNRIFSVYKNSKNTTYMYDGLAELSRNAFVTGAGFIFAGVVFLKNTIVNQYETSDALFSGAQSALRINGGLVGAEGNAGTFSATGLTLASRYNIRDFGGLSLCELLFYDNNVPLFADVENYLNAKWAIY